MMNSRSSPRLRRGDIVVVRRADEIKETLESDGTLDGLPFMPEMLQFCGQRFEVLYHVVQACVDGAYLGVHSESYVREFRNNDVVILKGVRCTGSEHDACQRGCAIFWKTSWLEKVPGAVPDSSGVPASPADSGLESLSALLKTKAGPNRYFCQSSEFLKATRHLPGQRRIGKCWSAVAAGNISAWGMLKRIMMWLWWKSRTRVFGEHARGTQASTPTLSLDLRPGELVQVKSFDEIVATLNEKGRNRGLHFSGDQSPYCGGQYQVRSRLDRFIAEGTGELKHFRNTVTLEDVVCDSSFYAFGGCYRCDLLYWREMWLDRVQLGPKPDHIESGTIEVR
jgi:hypothetical protein